MAIATIKPNDRRFIVVVKDQFGLLLRNVEFSNYDDAHKWALDKGYEIKKDYPFDYSKAVNSEIAKIFDKYPNSEIFASISQLLSYWADYADLDEETKRLYSVQAKCLDTISKMTN